MKVKAGHWRMLGGVALLLAGCSPPEAVVHMQEAPPPPAPAIMDGSPLPPLSSIPPETSAVLLAAGDIANCNTDEDEATARLLDNLDGTIATLGDNVYADGTAAEFRSCYDPTWGRHKARTRPAPGNHDYHVPAAPAYYTYFGAHAGAAGKGYYSYDLDGWHVIVLNSETGVPVGAALARCEL